MRLPLEDESPIPVKMLLLSDEMEKKRKSLIQHSQIQDLIDQYASLENPNNARTGLSFIINSYLVAVGFRPLYYSDVYSRDEIFQENLIEQTAILFSQLTFRRESKSTYVHHPLLELEYNNHKELGALLNFIDLVDLDNKPEERNTVLFLCSYKNINFIILTSYIIRGSTQVNQITNKVFQMRLLLKELGVKVQVQLEP